MDLNALKKLALGNAIPATRAEKPCGICTRPMLVAPGQIAYYHKACRKFRHNRKAGV